MPIDVISGDPFTRVRVSRPLIGIDPQIFGETDLRTSSFMISVFQWDAGPAEEMF